MREILVRMAALLAIGAYFTGGGPDPADSIPGWCAEYRQAHAPDPTGTKCPVEGCACGRSLRPQSSGVTEAPGIDPRDASWARAPGSPPPP